MRITRQAVSVMQAFTGSIHDVTKALFFKSSEDGRHVRVDDLKYALDAAEEPDRPGTRLERDEIGDTAHPSRYRPSALAARTLRARRRLARNLRGPRRQTFAPRRAGRVSI